MRSCWTVPRMMTESSCCLLLVYMCVGEQVYMGPADAPTVGTELTSCVPVWPGIICRSFITRMLQEGRQALSWPHKDAAAPSTEPHIPMRGRPCLPWLQPAVWCWLMLLPVSRICMKPSTHSYS